MKPIVSVILPNYNHAKYLPKRIDSIINQLFTNFELIILDDCSTDESAVIIEKYRNFPQVSHIQINKKNSGSTFKQWRKGIEMAQGKYIWIAESDDYADVNFLAAFVPILEKNGNIGLIFCESNIVNEQNKILGKWNDFIKPNWKWQSDFVQSGKSLIQNHMILGNCIPNASAVVFRKELFFEIKNTDYQNFKLMGDWFFWINLLQMCDVAYLKKTLNYFRKHTQNVRTQSRRSGLEVYELAKLQTYLFDNQEINNFSKRKMLYILALVWSNAIRKKQIPLHQSWRTLKLINKYDKKILWKLHKKSKHQSFPPRNWRDIKILIGEVLFPNIYKLLKQKSTK